ncbi:transglycosylase family protein [Streptomyces orinoci]|uniref:Transglycosylase family protein n=1 Tax=Streptomyces orinoci TaxID=67339 RepID=A0ABV3K304_STRON|nr:transglycosylase family protein [Streptomyces orinoci]
MLSGSGRHRRPRQIPALVVTAGVTGAGLALPLMAASGAQAADAQTWDRVAQCESGGLWSADSGDGYYGGLQLTRSMWEQHGGTEFAPRPDLASRAQQIAVAERILQDRGPYAWPSCAVDSGLAKDGPAPKVDPGPEDGSQDASPGSTHRTAPQPSSSAPANSRTGKTGSPDDAPDSSASPRQPDQRPPVKDDDRPTGKHRKPADGSSGDTVNGPSGKPSAQPSGTPSADPSAGPSASPADGSDQSAHPGDSTPGQDPHTGANTDGSTGKHRADSQDSGADRASRGGAEARTQPPSANDYTVRPGDNLSVIAEQHSVQGGWHRLYRDNQKVVGDDPDLILPGQQLELKK